MFETPVNQKTVSIKLKRRYVVDLMLACAEIQDAAQKSGESGEKWAYLHDTLKEQLNAFDAKQERKDAIAE